jgi:hypothetical protein
MPKIGYGYAIYTGKPGLPPVTPDEVSGLSLWLKADAGVITGSGTPFLSTIVISGAGTTTSNGTYILSSGNGYTRIFSRVGGGGYIAYTYCPVADTDAWIIFDNTFGDQTYYSSDDSFLNWSIAYGSANPPSATTSNTTPVVVTTWEDQSPNKYNLSNNEGNTQYSDLGTKKVIRFEGSSSLIFPGGGAFNNLSAMSFFAVWKINNTGSNGGILGTANYSNFEIASDSVSVVRIRNGDFTDSFIQSGWWDSNSLSLSSFAVDSTPSGSARKNGGESGITQTIANVSMPLASPSPDYFIGQYAQDAGSYFSTCDIAEIIVYNRKLSIDEIQQLERYLNTKYSIY